MINALLQLKMLGCFGCLSWLLGVMVALACLIILMTVLGINTCDLWLIGGPLCELF